MLGLKKIANFALINGFESVRWSSSLKREFKEVVIKVPWGHIAGKWWEPYDKRPILTVHGWQDNCQSFDRLIPMLNRDVGFLTIDLPGHGHSSRLPGGMFYHYTVYLLAMKSIAKNFNWPKISLMGHSLGGILSYTYTMYFPTEVDYLICIEGTKPTIPKNKQRDYSKIFERFFKYDDFARDKNEPPSYTFDELKKLISQPNNNSILPEYANYIFERNVAPSKIQPGKYYMTRDPRLKTGVMVDFCQNELLQLAENIKMPIFICKATDFGYYEPKENFYEVLEILKRTSVDCDFHYVEGKHHVHLNTPENVAGLINNFIQKHNTGDRSVGGLSDHYIIKDVKQFCLN